MTLPVLVVVDHAEGSSGPHRNVVGSLNALSRRQDLNVRLLCGRIDQDEPYANSRRLEVRLGFEPHRASAFAGNLRLIHGASRDRELIYVPAGLKSFLYSYAVKGARKLVAGPNVSGIPVLMSQANPSPLMTTRMADAWLEMSEVRVRACVRAGTARERISVVPHAIDTERFSPSQASRDVWRELGLDPESLKLIYVGRMDKELKGIPQLIDAFRLIRQRFPAADLVLVGKPGAELTAEHRSLKGVHVIGPRFGVDLVRLLASADLFLGPSRWETFWFTPLEAMACGLAVVASAAGAVPQMIPEDGEQGRIVRLTDPTTAAFLPDAAQRLAAAAIPLLEEPELRARMARKGREHVAQAFSEERLGEQLSQIFFRTARGGAG
jgi:glycosyltransferase involved in cell wall biosynthesis